MPQSRFKVPSHHSHLNIDENGQNSVAFLKGFRLDSIEKGPVRASLIVFQRLVCEAKECKRRLRRRGKVNEQGGVGVDRLRPKR